MRYGHFDDNAMEYVIDTPATPLPWINYLGSQEFFSLISNTGGGYSFYRDAKLRRITRYRYNGVPFDAGGRLYYIIDGENVWSPCFLPVKAPLDSYRCRHGLGYTVFESSKNQLDAVLTCLVPMGDNCEINCLTLTNGGGAPKKIELVGAVEFCLWNAMDDAINYQRTYNLGEVEVEGGVIYHKTEFRERRNHYSYYSVNHPTDGFDTDRDAFLGRFNGWDTPSSVFSGQSGATIANGWNPIGSHRVSFTLAPGESKDLIFVLGYAELPEDEKWENPDIINKQPAKKILSRYSSVEDVKSALSELSLYWRNLLSRFHVESGDEKLDRMANIWNQYQCMVTFNMSRSASYFESGTGRGMGFRDSCQDLLGFVHMVPERARERILDIAAIQLEDGSTWHQYQPLTKRGNADAGTGFNDDPLWLIACVHAYVAETGDGSILYEPVVFDNTPGTEAPLLEHLRRSVQYTLAHLGPHGLPLIGRADWNDCLNLNCFSVEPGESFQTCANYDSGIAESVFIAGMFVLYAGKYAELCLRYGGAEESERVLEAVERMKMAIHDHGWDGEWFLRAYDALGQKVGSAECPEGQIFIEPQGMCVMAGVGVENGRAKTALGNVRERLTSKYGTCLLAPCYSKYYKNLGEISSYPPGYKENGSIFCHNNPWISIAEAIVGNPGEAFNVYMRTCPAYTEELSDIHRTEPYVYSQTIAGSEAATFGEAKNSWLTGTAAWTFVNVSQYLLGIQPTCDGLRINPCLPDNFVKLTVKRYFRGAMYHISLERTGKSALFADGKAIQGNIIPPAPQGSECRITVTF